MNKLSTLLASVKQQIGFVYAPQTPVMVNLAEAISLAADLGPTVPADIEPVVADLPAAELDRLCEAFKIVADADIDAELRVGGPKRLIAFEYYKRGYLQHRGTTADQHAAGSVEADTVGMKLHSTMDAKVWTDEFKRIFPQGCADEGTMLGWFANAIMVGYDHAKREERAALDSAKPVAAGELPTDEQVAEICFSIHPDEFGGPGNVDFLRYDGELVRHYLQHSGQQCADSRPAGGVADLVAAIETLPCPDISGNYRLGFRTACARAATLAASAAQPAAHELLTEVADVLAENNWRGDLVERLREASAVQAGAVPDALAIVQEFVRDSYDQDVGGGDLVVTTCEVREKAVKLLDSLRDPSLGQCGLKPTECADRARCGCKLPAAPNNTEG